MDDGEAIPTLLPLIATIFFLFRLIYNVISLSIARLIHYYASSSSFNAILHKKDMVSFFQYENSGQRMSLLSLELKHTN